MKKPTVVPGDRARCDDEEASLLTSNKDMHPSSVGSTSSERYASKPKGKIRQWLCSTNFLLYCSHGLSAWGDRMWQFGAGMFLVALNPESLRLTAIYGFSSGGAVLLFGAIVGNWVDKYPRLRVAQTSIIIANIFVTLSAGTVCIAVWFEDILATTWDGWLETLLEVIIIASAVVADVASIGRTIAIERDWIVVICGDTESLTNMSAFLRRLDLLTNLAAPIVTGQIITYGSMFIGAIFIAVWNIISMIIEYVLLYVVYTSVPDLAKEKNTAKVVTCDEAKPLLSNDKQTATYGIIASEDSMEETNQRNLAEKNTTETTNCLSLMLESFLVLYRGWKTYIEQPIVFAGLGLATVYMTVLGFDNITTGFAKEQGLSESLISILLAAGSILGVFGTVLFPILRSRVGLQRTGLFASFFQLSCLALCVASVFVAGSPFDPYFLSSKHDHTPRVKNDTNLEMSTQLLAKTNIFGNDFTSYSFFLPLRSSAQQPEINGDINVRDAVEYLNQANRTREEFQTNTAPNISIILLMAGIVLSRTGLWMFDLTVTQLLLETPHESERGIVNGVQNSLNKFMDIIKSVLVIVLPWPQTFGYLIILSYAFVTIGGLLYAIYSRKARGHLFHFQDYQNQSESNTCQDAELKTEHPLTI